MGLKIILYLQHVVLCERLVIHQVMTYLLPLFVLKKPHVSVLQYQNDTTIRKHFFWTEAVSDDPILFYLDHSWALAFPNSIPLSILHTTRVTQKPLSISNRVHLCFCGLGGSVGLSVLSYLKWVLCSLPSKAWVSFEKLFLVEYLSFRDEGIQTILLLGYRFSVWFTYCFCWCYHGNVVNPARVLS